MSVKITADTYVSEEVRNHPAVRICDGTCKRWTRSGSMTLTEFPGTVVRSADGKCQRCINDLRRGGTTSLAEADAKLRHTITGLESFMAKRRQRIGQ